MPSWSAVKSVHFFGSNSIPHKSGAGSQVKPLKIEEVAQLLENLGLAPDEARVYIHLLVLGPSRAGDLASTVRLSRPRTYRALERLIGRGFASADFARPRRFFPASEDILINGLLRESEANTQEIQRIAPDLKASLGNLKVATPPIPKESRLDVLRGRQVVLNQVGQLVDQAKSRIQLVSTHPAWPSFLTSMGRLEALRRRAEEGVQIQLILYPPAVNADVFATELSHPNIGVRELVTDEVLGLLVVDNHEAITILVADPSSRLKTDKTVTLWTDAPNFVANQRLLFERLWDLAKPAEGSGAAHGRPPHGPAGAIGLS